MRILPCQMWWVPVQVAVVRWFSQCRWCMSSNLELLCVDVCAVSAGCEYVRGCVGVVCRWSVKVSESELKQLFSTQQLQIILDILFMHPVSCLCVQLTVNEQHKQFVQLCRCIVVLHVYCCYCYNDKLSLCRTSVPVAPTVSPTVQTVHQLMF